MRASVSQLFRHLRVNFSHFSGRFEKGIHGLFHRRTKSVSVTSRRHLCVSILLVSYLFAFPNFTLDKYNKGFWQKSYILYNFQHTQSTSFLWECFRPQLLRKSLTEYWYCDCNILLFLPYLFFHYWVKLSGCWYNKGREKRFVFYSRNEYSILCRQ